MDEQAKDLQFLKAVVGFLVEHPEALKINRVVDEMGVLLSMDVHPDDMKQVIGREGNTAKAIRTLLRVVGMKSNARVNLKINEPEGSSPRPKSERPERNYDRASNRSGYNDRGYSNDRGGYRNDRRSGRGFERDNRGNDGYGDDHGYAN